MSETKTDKPLDVAPVVNEVTASVLADPKVAKLVSKPGAYEGINPLEVSERSLPLDFFPTIESRDIPANVTENDAKESEAAKL